MTTQRLAKLPRFRVYRAPRRDYLCICAARDSQHALKVARQMFTLGREAFAVRHYPDALPAGRPA